MVIIDILFQSTSNTSTLGTYFDRPMLVFSHIHAGVYSRINQVHKVSREDEHCNVCNLYIYTYTYT